MALGAARKWEGFPRQRSLSTGAWVRTVSTRTGRIAWSHLKRPERAAATCVETVVSCPCDRQRLIHHATVEERDHPLRMPRILRVMSHHADGRTATMELAQQLHDGLAVLRVEIPGWLVGEQYRRIASDCARHRNALLLAAGEL